MGSFSLLRQYGSKCQFEFGSSNSQFEPADKNSNPRGFLQSAEPYDSKSQFENGASASQFEPFEKKIINTEKGEVETEIDETATENINIHTITNEAEKEKTNSNTITTKITNEEFKTYSNLTKTVNEELKIESREDLNIRIESKSKTKNKQIAKTKTKVTPSTIQKFSSHIKFIDYILTHELITYRHLFAYGLYVEIVKVSILKWSVAIPIAALCNFT